MVPEFLLFQLAQGFDDRCLLFDWARIFPYVAINPIGSHAQLLARECENMRHPACFRNEAKGDPDFALNRAIGRHRRFPNPKR
jgi:hypothetical protein